MARASYHKGASQAADTRSATRLARLVSRHALPPREGAHESTQRMLDAVAALLAGKGSVFEAAKVEAWVRRFPLRTAEQPELGWDENTATYKQAVAEDVLMHGIHPAMVADAYSTTHATVLAIVAQHREKIRRSKGQPDA